MLYLRQHGRWRQRGSFVSNRPAITSINLGGEGEEPGVINQQRPSVLSPLWVSSRAGISLEQLATQGHDFLICRNTLLPIHDDSVDVVFTNSVPIDIVVFGEPGVQSSEIRRILAPGDRWIHDGNVRLTKP
jgi:hypothetical protein